MKIFLLVAGSFCALYGILSLIRVQEEHEFFKKYPKRWIIIYSLVMLLLGLFAIIKVYLNQYSEYD